VRLHVKLPAVKALCDNKRDHASIAQWIERRASDANVGGSNPSRRAIENFVSCTLVKLGDCIKSIR
jgi:hypothetical protein